jgi:hypothetical protein
MIHSETSQPNAFQNPLQQNPQVLYQLAQALLQQAQNQQSQQGPGQGAYGQGVYGGQFGGMNWGAQRHLTPMDVSNILQQVAPILPQILAQAQQQQHQPLAAFGGGFGAYQRNLSPQDVSEVVRQILPVIPQILQSAQQQTGFGQQGLGWSGLSAYGFAQQNPFQHPHWQQYVQHRQVTQADIQEVARQLAETLAFSQNIGQQRPF